MSNIRLNKNMIGKEVRCIYKYNCYHPKVGTIGTIIQYASYDVINSYKVQWPKGSTIEDDRWWAINKCIELVEDDETNGQKIPEMTNEEIWEMLHPKLVKNGLDWIDYGYDSEGNKFYYFDEKALMNAVTTAYKSGYYRSQKGRPFKIGEKKAKKQGGHWEPVDPENLPKEGTKVKYSREYKDYADSDEYICINDTSIIKLKGSWFGVTLDNPHRYEWICFDNAEDCLDMWVEDDE